ncbi:MAG: hypothetical protein IIB65_12305 [Proteobacteria bacterium]|nr:hypothetical protein [Pseudomonadota bacterium]MCH8091375.1 hypothetical protein [Pseudomonadota bacterium]MCH8097412.1 hypothetical protein [Pseudomonadota bacterium]
MEIRTALALEIGRLEQPVVTSYDIGRLVFRLYQAKTHEGEKLSRIHKDYPERQDYNRLVKTLLRAGVLREKKTVPNPDVFTVLGTGQPSSGEVACCVDPFAYVSHLSAMEWHGLTDRIAKTLFISSPAPPDWKKFSLERMLKDLGSSEAYAVYRYSRLPQLRRLNLAKVGRETVHRHASLHPGAFIAVRDRRLRVATIGRTFLDMIREPDLCGGIYHVLGVYREHVERSLRLVVDEIDRHGTKIEKMRGGYILEERLGLKHGTIDEWVKFAQRGGSRKLYAHSEYSPRFSEKWCLSLNIEE